MFGTKGPLVIDLKLTKEDPKETLTFLSEFKKSKFWNENSICLKKIPFWIIKSEDKTNQKLKEKSSEIELTLFYMVKGYNSDIQVSSI